MLLKNNDLLIADRPSALHYYSRYATAACYCLVCTGVRLSTRGYDIGVFESAPGDHWVAVLRTRATPTRSYLVIDGEVTQIKGLYSRYAMQKVAFEHHVDATWSRCFAYYSTFKQYQ